MTATATAEKGLSQPIIYPKTTRLTASLPHYGILHIPFPFSTAVSSCFVTFCLPIFLYVILCTNVGNNHIHLRYPKMKHAYRYIFLRLLVDDDLTSPPRHCCGVEASKPQDTISRVTPSHVPHYT